MISPTNHEGGTEPRQRVSARELHLGAVSAVQFAQSQGKELRHSDIALLDFRERLIAAEATIAALRERVETSERKRDEARAERDRSRELEQAGREMHIGDMRECWKMIDDLRDREQRGEQVTKKMVEVAVAVLTKPGAQSVRQRIETMLTATRAARPTGQPSDPAEVRIAEAVGAVLASWQVQFVSQPQDRWLIPGRDLRALAAAIRAPRDEESEI